MKYIYMVAVLVLLLPFTAGEVIDAYTMVEHGDGWDLLTYHSEPAYYDTPYGWEEIDTTLLDDPDNSYAFKVDKMKSKVQFTDKPNKRDTVKITKKGKEFTITPIKIGYVGEYAQISMRVPQNVLGTTNKNKVHYKNGWGEGINFTFEVTSTQVIKEILVDKMERFPPAPQEMLPEACWDWCFDPPIKGYIDFEIKGPRGTEFIINGSVWDEEEEIETMDPITIRNGNTSLLILPPYMITNYEDTAGNLSSWIDLSYTLYQQTNKDYLRLLLPYQVLRNNETYPLYIDPVIQIDNTSTRGVRRNFNDQCVPAGQCCFFPYTGTCTHQSDFEYTCVESWGSLTENTKTCSYGCQSGYCCQLTGNYKRFWLVEYNWSSVINSSDYERVVVNSAYVNISINFPNGFTDIWAWHHDTDYLFPECLPVHPNDGFPNPPKKAAATKMLFNFTDHVQWELTRPLAPADERDTFFVMLESDSTSARFNRKLNYAKLELNYSITPPVNVTEKPETPRTGFKGGMLEDGLFWLILSIGAATLYLFGESRGKKKREVK